VIGVLFAVNSTHVVYPTDINKYFSHYIQYDYCAWMNSVSATPSQSDHLKETALASVCLVIDIRERLCSHSIFVSTRFWLFIAVPGCCFSTKIYHIVWGGVWNGLIRFAFKIFYNNLPDFSE